MSTLRVNAVTNLSDEAQFMPVLRTAQPSTSGTFIDFTSIPSWVKRITVMLNGVSTNGTSNLLCQVGSGSITSSGYLSNAIAGTNTTGSTAGFLITSANAAAYTQTGIATIALLGSNAWVFSSATAPNTSNSPSMGAGSVTLSGTLDRIRVTTVNGTDAFDAGTINIMYE